MELVHLDPCYPEAERGISFVVKRIPRLGQYVVERSIQKELFAELDVRSAISFE